LSLVKRINLLKSVFTSVSILHEFSRTGNTAISRK